MDSVLKSWGFRTSRDPFQENSSQGLEANKGQKSTPLRRVVCPLERLGREQLQLERVPGADVSEEAERETLGRWSRTESFVVFHFLHTELCPHVSHACVQLQFVREGTEPDWCVRRAQRLRHLHPDANRDLGRERFCDRTHLVVYHLESVQSIDSGGPLSLVSKHCLAVSVAPQSRYQPGMQEPKRPYARNVSSRFFDVLTARVFQEKKS